MTLDPNTKSSGFSTRTQVYLILFFQKVKVDPDRDYSKKLDPGRTCFSFKNDFESGVKMKQT
jgi:hypothetical protein